MFRHALPAAASLDGPGRGVGEGQSDRLAPRATVKPPARRYPIALLAGDRRPPRSRGTPPIPPAVRYIGQASTRLPTACERQRQQRFSAARRNAGPATPGRVLAQRPLSEPYTRAVRMGAADDSSWHVSALFLHDGRLGRGLRPEGKPARERRSVKARTLSRASSRRRRCAPNASAAPPRLVDRRPAADFGPCRPSDSTCCCSTPAVTAKAAAGLTSTAPIVPPLPADPICANPRRLPEPATDPKATRAAGSFSTAIVTRSSRSRTAMRWSTPPTYRSACASSPNSGTTISSSEPGSNTHKRSPTGRRASTSDAPLHLGIPTPGPARHRPDSRDRQRADINTATADNPLALPDGRRRRRRSVQPRKITLLLSS